MPKAKAGGQAPAFQDPEGVKTLTMATSKLTEQIFGTKPGTYGFVTVLVSTEGGMAIAVGHLERDVVVDVLQAAIQSLENPDPGQTEEAWTDREH